MVESTRDRESPLLSPPSSAPPTVYGASWGAWVLRQLATGQAGQGVGGQVLPAACCLHGGPDPTWYARIPQAAWQTGRAGPGLGALFLQLGVYHGRTMYARTYSSAAPR